MKTNLLMAALVVGLVATWPMSQASGPTPTPHAQFGAPDVVVNEVAWAGTVANAADEWIELRNNSSSEIDLTGFALEWDDGGTVIRFAADAESNATDIRRATIPADGFLLLERTDDDTISDVEADVIYTGSLNNGGEALVLRDDDGEVVDEVNADGSEWPAGASSDGEVPHATMERIDPTSDGKDSNWASNDGVIRNGTDVGGNQINGTPKAENSQKNTN
ncbi:MAG: lamin tail domain-containing protein [Candidatus Bipolaricaulia bacterium]